jgi:hypothetical protein
MCVLYVNVCMYVCVYVCMYVHVCIYILKHIHASLTRHGPLQFIYQPGGTKFQRNVPVPPQLLGNPYAHHDH